MSGRPDLRLNDTECRVFLSEVLAAEPVAWAVAGDDGYPEVGLVAARMSGDALAFDASQPADGASVCVIVERGATYDDITAVVARGTVDGRHLPLDDLVTFSFAKATRR
jgi:hypothetical protein